jgi:ADP-ribose pyrophosphatase YjhB (NUDIX family)
LFLLSSANGYRFETTSTDGRQHQDWSDILPYQNGSHGSVKVIIPAIKEGEQQQQSSESPLTSPLDPFEVSMFRQRLEATVNVCRAQQKFSIWVEVPMSRARLIEDMASLGFTFHHAQGSIAHLNLWLKDSECKIPEYATHHVGVGAVVVNSRNEILCVRELRNNYMPWKIPGGLAELGEQIDEAVVREVLEETGVPTKFVNVLAFRHSHGMANGRSDLFFVCRLEPIESVDESNGRALIPEPVAQQSEIEVAAWVPLSEYRNMVDQGHPMMRHVMKLYDQGQNIEKTVVQSIVPGRASNPIYHPPLERRAGNGLVI